MAFALAVLALLAQAPPPLESAPDSVWLKGGKLWNGTLLRADETEVELLDEKGEVRNFDRKRVKAMAGPRAQYAEFRERLRQAYSDRSSADEAFAFAGWCLAHGYRRDERLALWRALAIDETHEGAHRALGHVARGEVWSVPVEDGQMATWTEMLRMRTTPEKPWSFTTMHFTVEVSGPLDRAVVAAAAAEYFYGELYAWFQDRAQLWDLRRPIAIRVWPARDRGYPPVDPRREGHWDRTARVLHTWFAAAAGGVERPVNYEALLAEAILSAAAEERTNSPSEVPAWLSVGAGLLLAEGSQWGSGLPSCDPRRPAQARVDRHAALAAPRTAAQLAVAADAEFRGPRAEELAAQAYTLLHFLLFAEAAAFDREFRAFLQAAARNLGAGGAFSESFGRRLRELEQAWPERVARLSQPSPGARQ